MGNRTDTVCVTYSLIPEKASDVAPMDYYAFWTIKKDTPTNDS